MSKEEKIKDIDTESIKRMDVLPKDIVEGGLAHMGDAPL